MADASLDDFFAKKDKSKKKLKTKSNPVVNVGNVVSDDKPKKEKKKRDKEKTQPSSNCGPTTTTKRDEEWIDFQEEAESDLSGLRIQNLQISGKEGEEGVEETEEFEEGEDGEIKEKPSSATTGPWLVTGGQSKKRVPHPVKTTQPAPQPSKPKEEVTKPTGKYVPPGARASLAGGGSSSVVSTQQIRRKKEAPNIRSEDDFPTLGGPQPSEIEVPKAKYSNPSNKTSSGPQLAMENRFACLRD